ncbi:Neutral ceramidase [Larimichthys crocea]|uniref:Uncharacterized protein n=1 Tax=Larimichthys crocea TaxID=215358 RepID=A0ACD3RUR2_LARCR|nr:Neutral ceramidase [Larimichthys crocea]
MSCKGYIKESIKPLVNGIVKSIDIAHDTMKPGRIYRNRGELDDSSLNRSPQSYLNNPKDERHRYEWNTDKQVLVLKFTDLNGDGIGMLRCCGRRPVLGRYQRRHHGQAVQSDAGVSSSQTDPVQHGRDERPSAVASSDCRRSDDHHRLCRCRSCSRRDDELESEGAFSDSEVVIAGLSNVYTHYITTYEEYQVQRYEGASTIYGPHTLSAYLQKYRGLARAIAQDRVSELPIGPQPPFFERNLFNWLPAASIDKKPVNSSFGDVLEQVYPVYRQGDVVSVTFVAGNPRNSGDIRDKTFVTVEIYDNRTDTWKVVHTDASWETRFHWLKGSKQQSNSTVEWHIPLSAPSGSYRIKHFGHSKERKNLRPVVTPYEGTSNVFKVATSFYYE